MKKNLFTILVFLLFFLFHSCHRTERSSPLILGFERSTKNVNNLDELFRKKRKQITLETTDEALVGRIGKIIKKNNNYFILSDDKQILEFDDNGRFVSKLGKLGSGPGEYSMITDFAVLINKDNQLEIWISDFKKIRKYRNTTGIWEQYEHIDYSYVINKFYVINTNCILLLTGQNDNSLTVTDGLGKTTASYLKSEIPFLVFKPVQFVKFDEYVVFQLGASNNCVTYSISDKVFKKGQIVCDDVFLTSKKLLDLFSKYEYDYLKELSAYSYIRTIRQIEEYNLIEFFMYGKRHVYVNTNNEWTSFSYDPYKLTDNNDYELLSTIGVGESQDSFIMFKNNADEDQNPIVVEY